MSSGQRHIWRGERGKEHTKAGGLIVTQGDGYEVYAAAHGS